MSVLVSVVIPTHARPDLAVRSVRSALAQSHRALEVIVVIDGHDSQTSAALSTIDDQRLRWVTNETSLGGSEARNIGTREGRGDLVAYLDDDDEWLPLKLERQVAAFARADGPTLVSCRIITRTPKRDFIGPERGPRPAEHLSDYLFRPRRPYARGARLQSSAAVVPRQLALDVPWNAGLTRFQDFDWFLRLASAGVKFTIVPETLAIWHFRDGRPTIGVQHAHDWRNAVEWIDDRRHLVSRHAYARWLLVRAASLAAAAGDPTPMPMLWHKARQAGQIGIVDVAQFAFYASTVGLANRFRSAST